MGEAAFDLDAVLAEEDAAEKRKPFPFTFDGKKYTLPPVMDVRALAAIEQGELAGILRHLLGSEQWAYIEASPKMLTVTAMSALVEAYYKYIGGADLGKLLASTGSSASTAKPSKRISSATTRSRSRGSAAKG